MKQYQTFIFDSYDFDPKSGKIELRYSLDDEIEFVETLTLPMTCNMPVAARPRRDGQPASPTPVWRATSNLTAALSALHIIGGISYFKTCLPPKIEMRSGALTSDQAQFWDTVYEKGLGEFCYKNNLPPANFVHFPSSVEHSTTPSLPHRRSSAADHSVTRRTLVPIGGGKDSVVTIEKMRQEGKSVTLFRIGAHPLISAFVDVAGFPCITVDRSLSHTLFDLNEEGALNGHIPITAYLSSLCVVIAELCGFDEIAMSNEKSANLGNVTYQGEEINHQWSKSEEFEKMFQKYIGAYVHPHLRYWSPLREMTELQIVGEFIKHTQYFPVTTSCNRNWRICKERSTDRFCRSCPKCAFAFALYAAYLPRKSVETIFEGNLFVDSSLVPLYEELLGLRGCKPFECVGTQEETREAFRMIHERGEFEDTPIMNLCA